MLYRKNGSGTKKKLSIAQALRTRARVYGDPRFIVIAVGDGFVIKNVPT